MNTTDLTSREITTEVRVAVAPATFPRVLQAEWIKLWSLRSTYWTVFATIGAMIAIALLMGAAAFVAPEGEGSAPDGTSAIGLGYTFAQVVVAVLGTLAITGEYSTGMIRSSLAAVPRRVPVLLAKALIVAGLGFILGVLGVALSYAASYPLLGADAADLSDPQVQRIFWGTGLYLAAIALLGLGVGALLRHTAGAITTTLGVLLMLSTLVQLLMIASPWFTRIYPYLPSTAGERIATPEVGSSVAGAPVALDPWLGFAVLLSYVALVMSSAAVLLWRRDA